MYSSVGCNIWCEVMKQFLCFRTLWEWYWEEHLGMLCALLWLFLEARWLRREYQWGQVRLMPDHSFLWCAVLSKSNKIQSRDPNLSYISNAFNSFYMGGAPELPWCYLHVRVEYNKCRWISTCILLWGSFHKDAVLFACFNYHICFIFCCKIISFVEIAWRVCTQIMFKLWHFCALGM